VLHIAHYPTQVLCALTQKEKKQAVMAEYRTHESDTGSPEVQVAVLTERVVRQLLQERNPGIALPNPIEQDEHAITEPRSPETYLGASRSQYRVSGTPPLGYYALQGEWDVNPMDITPRSDGATVELHYQARWVQLVASGRGTVTVKRADGTEQTFDITGDGTVDIIRKDNGDPELITIAPSPGIHLYSITFG